MITEDYVSFEIAKLLKEKGFDVYGDGSFNSGIEVFAEYSPSGTFNKCSTSKPHQKAYPAPTLQMAMKWLREVHNIDINVYAESISHKKRYTISIWKNIQKDDAINDVILGVSTIYEEACETAIKYCFENLIK